MQNLKSSIFRPQTDWPPCLYSDFNCDPRAWQDRNSSRSRMHPGTSSDVRCITSSLRTSSSTTLSNVVVDIDGGCLNCVVDLPPTLFPRVHPISLRFIVTEKNGTNTFHRRSEAKIDYFIWLGNELEFTGLGRLPVADWASSPSLSLSRPFYRTSSLPPSIRLPSRWGGAASHSKLQETFHF